MQPTQPIPEEYRPKNMISPGILQVREWRKQDNEKYEKIRELDLAKHKKEHELTLKRIEEDREEFKKKYDKIRNQCAELDELLGINKVKKNTDTLTKKAQRLKDNIAIIFSSFVYKLLIFPQILTWCRSLVGRVKHIEK
jgi:hypothetical protein